MLPVGAGKMHCLTSPKIAPDLWTSETERSQSQDQSKTCYRVNSLLLSLWSLWSRSLLASQRDTIWLTNQVLGQQIPFIKYGRQTQGKMRLQNYCWKKTDEKNYKAPGLKWHILLNLWVISVFQTLSSTFLLFFVFCDTTSS